MTTPEQPDTYPDGQPPAETDLTPFASTEDDNPESLMGAEVVS